MKRFHFVSLTLATLMLGTTPGSALDLVFDYSYDSNNFFDTQAKRDAMEEAGNFFETYLGDTLTALPENEPTGESWDGRFKNPATGLDVQVGFSVLENALKIFVGGRDLGGSTLGRGGPGGYSASYFVDGSGDPIPSSQAFLDNLASRGESGALDDPATDFGPWGGTIAFDSDTDWYFDADISTVSDLPPASFDFYSVAIHEIGHLLGYGTSDSWLAQIESDTFTGSESVFVAGGPVNLYDSGHWAENQQSEVYGTNTPQEAAMDPNIANGQRKYWTELDMAGLVDIGWEVIPEPSALLLVSGAFLLVALRRRRPRDLA